jgi:hypothetical protein
VKKNKESVEEKCIMRGVYSDRRNAFYIGALRGVAPELFILSAEKEFCPEVRSAC